jgi:hypothetical protein
MTYVNTYCPPRTVFALTDPNWSSILTICGIHIICDQTAMLSSFDNFFDFTTMAKHLITQALVSCIPSNIANQP